MLCSVWLRKRRKNEEVNSFCYVFYTFVVVFIFSSSLAFSNAKGAQAHTKQQCVLMSCIVIMVVVYRTIFKQKFVFITEIRVFFFFFTWEMYVRLLCVRIECLFVIDAFACMGYWPMCVFECWNACMCVWEAC